MCIAIAKPKDIIIPLSHLEESFRCNPDGAGFAYADNDELHIEKGFMDFDSFYEAYKPHKEKAAVLHFRITTHGDTDAGNTHPFQVGKNMAVIHNGIISRVNRQDDLSRSDTYHFNTKYLSQFYKRDTRFIYKDFYADLIKEYIGASKLVFINNKGHHKIINEQMGVNEEGVWYSNNSFRPYREPVQRSFQGHNYQSQKKPESPVFTQGSRVRVNLPHRKGVGTIMHFTGGMMVGVLLDGEKITSMIPMSAMDLYIDPNNNPFKDGDWVVRTDNNTGQIGQVMGTSKKQVWVKYLGVDYQPDGPTYVMDMSKLSTYEDYSGC